jgi:hypothetical protein
MLYGREKIPGRRLARMALVVGLLVAGLLATVAFDRALALHGTTLAAVPDGSAAGQPAGDASIQATARISIPFRFSGRMPILAEGSELLAGGQGACTAGESVRVSFVISVPFGGLGNQGAWSETCTGRLQDWSAQVAATTGSAFVPGEAEVCGEATTLAEGYVTDSATWCEEVELVALDQALYLPLSLRGPN